ncbi:AraC family transcriptional regulator [Cohnella phaseoli]|uniref:AraC-like DNA-binding protein n=1 Tax=Cohnella phaseoli TaxID=456490 RepID=A0A3D9KR12_9BACL|nr:AraC family transcriptional regulator [Cohnella phaseoli]RED89100.1 AraC-like DNA-binding protein [Cohnella phaseoli]
MEIFKEPIHYQDPVLCLKVWQFEERDGTARQEESMLPATWHYHKEVEFLLVKQGAHNMFTPNRSYTLNEGDVMVIGSSQLHRGRPISKELVYIVLHFDLETYFDPSMMRYYRHFSEVSCPLEELNYIFRENAALRAEAGSIIERIHSEIMEKPVGYEIVASMQIKHLLLTLLRGDSRGLLQAQGGSNSDAMKPVLEYIEQNFSDRIELEEVSRLAGMSYSYFSKAFKKTMGLSFTSFVNRKKIAKAERLLATSGRNIDDIARSVGFENMAHFFKLFKRFNGCTPKEFKQKINAIVPVRE